MQEEPLAQWHSITCTVAQHHLPEDRNFEPNLVYFDVCHQIAEQNHDINMGNKLFEIVLP
jgi:hypothetical protein